MFFDFLCTDHLTSTYCQSASRGVGLEITRQLLRSASNTVFATCRSPSTAVELQKLNQSPDIKGKIHIVQLDQDDEQSISNAAKSVEQVLGTSGRIDFLINNAGIVCLFIISYLPSTKYAVKLPRKNDTPSGLNRQTFSQVMSTNILGPGLVAQAFLPFVLRPADESGRRVVINMTSGWGSLAGLTPGWYKSTTYSISKAGLNMLVSALSSFF